MVALNTSDLLPPGAQGQVAASPESMVTGTPSGPTEYMSWSEMGAAMSQQQRDLAAYESSKSRQNVLDSIGMNRPDTYIPEHERKAAEYAFNLSRNEQMVEQEVASSWDVFKKQWVSAQTFEENMVMEGIASGYITNNILDPDSKKNMLENMLLATPVVREMTRYYVNKLAPEDFYGGQWSTLDEERRTEMLVAHRAKALEETYGGIYASDHPAWSIAGTLTGVLSKSPTTLVPLGSQWKTAAMIGAGLGAAEVAAFNAATKDTFSWMETGVGALFGGAAAGGLMYLHGVVTRKLATGGKVTPDELKDQADDLIKESEEILEGDWIPDEPFVGPMPRGRDVPQEPTDFYGPPRDFVGPPPPEFVGPSRPDFVGPPTPTAADRITPRPFDEQTIWDMGLPPPPRDWVPGRVPTPEETTATIPPIPPAGPARLPEPPRGWVAQRNINEPPPPAGPGGNRGAYQTSDVQTVWPPGLPQPPRGFTMPSPQETSKQLKQYLVKKIQALRALQPEKMSHIINSALRLGGASDYDRWLAKAIRNQYGLREIPEDVVTMDARAGGATTEEFVEAIKSSTPYTKLSAAEKQVADEAIDNKLVTQAYAETEGFISQAEISKVADDFMDDIPVIGRSVTELNTKRQASPPTEEKLQALIGTRGGKTVTEDAVKAYEARVRQMYSGSEETAAGSAKALAAIDKAYEPKAAERVLTPDEAARLEKMQTEQAALMAKKEAGTTSAPQKLADESRDAGALVRSDAVDAGKFKLVPGKWERDPKSGDWYVTYPPKAYALTKDTGSGGKTQWKLHELDPKGGDFGDSDKVWIETFPKQKDAKDFLAEREGAPVTTAPAAKTQEGTLPKPRISDEEFKARMEAATAKQMGRSETDKAVERVAERKPKPKPKTTTVVTKKPGGGKTITKRLEDQPKTEEFTLPSGKKVTRVVEPESQVRAAEEAAGQRGQALTEEAARSREIANMTAKQRAQEVNKIVNEGRAERGLPPLGASAKANADPYLETPDGHLSIIEDFADRHWGVFDNKEGMSPLEAMEDATNMLDDMVKGGEISADQARILKDHMDDTPEAWIAAAKAVQDGRDPLDYMSTNPITKARALESADAKLQGEAEGTIKAAQGIFKKEKGSMERDILIQFGGAVIGGHIGYAIDDEYGAAIGALVGLGLPIGWSKIGARLNAPVGKASDRMAAEAEGSVQDAVASAARNPGEAKAAGNPSATPGRKTILENATRWYNENTWLGRPHRYFEGLGKAGKLYSELMKRTDERVRMAVSSSHANIQKALRSRGLDLEGKDAQIVFDMLRKVVKPKDVGLVTDKHRAAAADIRKILNGVLAESKKMGIIDDKTYKELLNNAATRGWMPRVYNTRYLSTSKGKEHFMETLSGHVFSNEIGARKAIQSLTGAGKDTLDSIIKSMNKSRDGKIQITPATAQTILRMTRNNNPKRSKYLENQRKIPEEFEAALEPFLMTDLKATTHQYLSDAMRRIEFARTFGKNDERVDKIAKMLDDEFHDPVMKERLWETYYLSVGDPASKNLQRFMELGELQRKTLSMTDTWTSYKLVLAQIVNAAQPIINGTVRLAATGENPVVAFFKSMNSVMKAYTDPVQRDIADRAGAAFESASMQFMGEAFNNSMPGVARSQGLGILNVFKDPHSFLKATGFIGVEKANRIAAYHLGKAHIESLLAQQSRLMAKQSNRMSKADIKELKKVENSLIELGLDPKKHPDSHAVGDVHNGAEVFTSTVDTFRPEGARSVSQAALKFSNDINFINNPLTRPLAWNSPYAKLFTKFKSFAFHQMHFVNQNIIKPIKNEEYGKAMNAASAYGIVGTGGGFTTNEFRKFILNDDNEYTMTERLLQGFTQAGALGLVTDVFWQATKSPTGFVDTLTGPIYQDIYKTNRAIYRAFDQGELGPVMKQAERSFGPSRPIRGLTRRVDKELGMGWGIESLSKKEKAKNAFDRAF
jgi:polyhydroxyalkanoate synthesis regulator phasin